MKLKVILQLIVVLALGFVLGFLTHSTIISNKIKNYSWRRGEVVFWNRTLDEVNATPDQKEKIMPIVIEYSEKGHEFMREAMQRVEPMWKDMEEEIAPFLTDEQTDMIKKIKKQRLEKFKNRTQRPGSGYGERRGKYHDENRKEHDGPPPPPPN